MLLTETQGPLLPFESNVRGTQPNNSQRGPVKCIGEATEEIPVDARRRLCTTDRRSGRLDAHDRLPHRRAKIAATVVTVMVEGKIRHILIVYGTHIRKCIEQNQPRKLHGIFRSALYLLLIQFLHARFSHLLLFRNRRGSRLRLRPGGDRRSALSVHLGFQFFDFTAKLLHLLS